MIETIELLSVVMTILVILYYCFKYPDWLVVVILILALVTLNRQSQPDNILLFVLSRINIGLTAYIIIDYLKLKKKMHYQLADQHWAALLLGSLYGIIGVDMDGTILHWNKAAEAIYGWREDEVRGRSIEVIIPKEVKNEYGEVMDKVKKGETVESYNRQRITKRGHKVTVDTTISPVVNPVTEEIIGATAVTRKVDE